MFLTACFTDAISGRDPKIGGAGVKHDGEPLGWRADAHNTVVLRLGEEQPGQPRAASRWAIPEEKADLVASRNASSGGSVQFHLNVNARHREVCLAPWVAAGSRFHSSCRHNSTAFLKPFKQTFTWVPHEVNKPSCTNFSGGKVNPKTKLSHNHAGFQAAPYLCQ